MPIIFILLLFFSVLPTPLNSGIVGFYRIDVGRYMVEKSPYIAKSISRIPLPPGMCQVVCGSPGRLGVGNSSLLRYGENRLSSLFSLPFSLRNKQRRRRRLSYKILFNAAVDMSTFYSRPQRNWRQCLRKILRVKQCVLWRFDIDSLQIGLPVVLYTDKIHKHTTWQPSNRRTVVEYLRNGRTFN